MALIKNFLLDKEFYVSVDNVEERLKELNVDPSSVIQSLIFDKNIFEEEQDARVWAREQGFIVDVVKDKTSVFEIDQYDKSEFVESSLKKIEVTKSVFARIGLLKVDTMAEMHFLSLRNDDKTIKLGSLLPHIIELAKVVKGYHVNYGEIEITKDMLIKFADNFKNKVTGVDISIDFDHDMGKAAGWLKDVFVSYDGKTLFGEVVWTPKGAQALSDKDFRYFSPEFNMNYVHPHTGKEHGPTLLGGGLVNRPFLKMDAIVSLKEKMKEGDTMETIKLSEHKEVVGKLEKQIVEFQLTEGKTKTILSSMKDENKKLSEKLETLESEKAKAELEAKNKVLFDEGKINAAQLKAMNEGKGLHEVLSLATNVKVESKGAVAKNNDDVKLSEEDLKAIKALGISKEDYIKYNGGM